MGVCVSTEPDFASGLGGSRYRTTEEAAAGTNVELFARGPRPGWMSLGNDLERAA
jgi:N6-adenosine-specific RNA methylase IME4